MQALFLLRIHYFKGTCQKDLVERFFLSKGTVAKSLKILEDNDFIIRKRLPENRRQYVLKLTSKGQKIIPKIKEINIEWERKMELNDLNPDFMKVFKDLTLKSIYLNEGGGNET